jgi:hypothetical protein
MGPCCPTSLATQGSGPFLPWHSDAATTFVNDKTFGSLSCLVIASAQVSPALVDSVVDRLEYGCVAVNHWPLFGWNLGLRGGAWGAHPRRWDCEPDGGVGRIGNLLQLPSLVKSVVRNTTPLGSKQPLDLGADNPPLLMDAISALVCRSNPVRGVIDALSLVAIRVTQNVFAVLGVKWGSWYGAAL